MTNFNEQRQKAFEFCADVAKQLITLATGIIVITITFAKDFIIHVNDAAKPWAYWAWFCYLASIVFGMITLLALTAELEPRKPSTKTPTIRDAAATYSGLQIILFGVALLLTILFAMNAIKNPVKKVRNDAEHTSRTDERIINPDTMHNLMF